MLVLVLTHGETTLSLVDCVHLIPEEGMYFDES